MRFALALVLISLAGPAAATSTIYTNRAAWEAAAGGPSSLETFDSLPDQTIPYGVGGTFYTDGFDIVVPQSDVLQAKILGGWFDIYIDGPDPLAQPSYNEMVFHSPITAFAGTIKIEQAQRISVTIAGETVQVSQGFFGLIADAPFTVVHIDGGHSVYGFDNVRSVPAPEPSAAALMAAALGLLGAAACRRYSVVSQGEVQPGSHG